MKPQMMSIDITKLTTEEIKSLRSMFYNMNMMDEVSQLNDRIAFLEGWMNDEQVSEYYKKHFVA